MAKLLVADDRTSARTVVERALNEDLKSLLGSIADLPGVSSVVLVDREGFLIESTGDMVPEPEVVGALVACLAASSQDVGRELDQGTLTSMILEFDAGLVLVTDVGPTAMLGTIIGDTTVLGRVRDNVRRVLPDLEKLL